jgi:exopolyphosphatase/pppGpp-phosphohydrolase
VIGRVLFSLSVLVMTAGACGPSAVPPAASTPRAMCVIDMGSNNFRRIVGAFADGRYHERVIESRTMAVGDDVERHGGRISDAKLQQIAETLSQFKTACAADGIESPPVAVGTAVFRDASNGPAVIEVASTAGVKMEIATEQRESELAYLVGSLGAGDFAVIDNGSRSIEFVARPGGRYQHRVYTLGYRIAYERFFRHAPHPKQGIAAFRAALLEHLPALGFMKGQQMLVGVEFMEMAEVLFREVPDGHVLRLAELKTRLDAIANLAASDVQAFNATEDLDRALPRLVTAVTMMEALGYDAMQVTSRQLGTGLIIEAGLRR